MGILFGEEDKGRKSYNSRYCYPYVTACKRNTPLGLSYCFEFIQSAAASDAQGSHRAPHMCGSVEKLKVDLFVLKKATFFTLLVFEPASPWKLVLCGCPKEISFQSLKTIFQTSLQVRP